MPSLSRARPARVGRGARSPGDSAEHLGADGHHPDDLSKEVGPKPLASHVSDPDRIGGLIAGMLATLERVSRQYVRGVSPRRYASAFAFSASNSCCVSAPASSSSSAFAISAADPPPPAVSRT
jgi:hypothetical protein